MSLSELIFHTYNEAATICYGTHASAHGEVVVLSTEKGICGFHFLEEPLAYYLHLTKKKFNVLPVYAPSHAKDWWQCIHQTAAVLSLVVRGTAFQQRVWKALCAIPVGTTCSYQALATQLGSVQGARAVASAIAQNFIAWLIPCHRVIRQDGQIGGYRWGIQRKFALLEQEKVFSCASMPGAAIV
ncbi:MAG: MGMT family protein [Amoebophilaceae bacterium]|jgi:AraC family transcriptional regulator of adaptative response/methylated-DNA-[protein]-cysteine methyltransferase|nr:MGMT family protein [Amoebophilaceae bacterium]